MRRMLILACQGETKRCIVTQHTTEDERNIYGDTYDYVTAPGEQRGDPSDRDQVLSMQISFSYNLGTGFKGGGFKRGRMQCPKW